MSVAQLDGCAVLLRPKVSARAEEHSGAEHSGSQQHHSTAEQKRQQCRERRAAEESGLKRVSLGCHHCSLFCVLVHAAPLCLRSALLLACVLAAVLCPAQTHTPTHHAAVTSIIVLPADSIPSAASAVAPVSSRRRAPSPFGIGASAAAAASVAGASNAAAAVAASCSIITTSRDASIRCWTTPITDSAESHGSVSVGGPRLPRHAASASATAQGERTDLMRPVSLPWNAATPASSGSASASPTYSCLEGHSEWISSGVLLSDHSTLVTASLDCTVKFWNLRGADNPATAAAAPASNCVATIARHSDYVQSLAYSAFNQTLVTAGLNFQLFSWRITPTGPRAIEDLSGGGNPDSPFAAAAAANAGLPSSFGMHEFDQLRGSFYSTALSATGDTLVTGSSDEIVRIYDTRSGSAARSAAGGGSKNWLKLLGHQQTIRAVSITESVGTGLSQVFSASAEGSLKVWDLRVQKCINTFYPSSNDASRAAAGGRRAQSALIPLDRQVDLRERMRIQSLGPWASSSSTPLSSHPLAALTRSAAGTAPSGTNPSIAPAIWCMVLNAACTLAFTAGASPVVFVTDLASGCSSAVVCFRSNALSPTASSIVTLTLDEPNSLLWVGAWDGTVSAWDVSAVLRGGAAAAAATAGLASVRTRAPAGESRRSRPSSSVAHGRRKDVANHTALGDEEEEEEESHGVFPLLLSAPKLLLPLASLPPMEKALLLHDRLHVVAQHLSNSWSPCLSSNAAASALTSAFAAATPSASLHPPLIFSTWNILEGVCLDVLRLDGSLVAGAASSASGQGLWSLETLAEMLNAEFGRKANAHLAAINTPPSAAAPTTPTTNSIATPKAGKGKDVPASAAAGSTPAVTAPAPIASSKLVPNWCSIDVRFGCIAVSLERRNCFAADISKWVAADLQALPLLVPAAAANAQQLPVVAGASSRPASAKSSTSTSGNSNSLATTLGYSSLFAASFTASARANLGEQLLFTLFSEWMLIEDRLVVDAAAQRAGSSRNATPRSSTEEVSSSGGVFVRKGPLLLRPVPPSSRVLARFLFPDTVAHAFAGSSVLLARHSSQATGIDSLSSQQPVSARGSTAAARQHQLSSAMSAPGPNGLSTPASAPVHAAPNSGVGTTLTLLIVPPKSSAFVAQALSLPILPSAIPSASASSALTPSLGSPAPRSALLATAHRARNAYLRVAPSWVEGVLFAPGSSSSPQALPAGSALPVDCERDRRSIVEQESASEGDEWIRKCKQMQAALLPAKPATPAAPSAAAAAVISSIASAGSRASGTFGRPSTPQLAPVVLASRDPTDNSSAAPSSNGAALKPQSQDLPAAEDESPKAVEPTISVSSNTSSTPSRRGTAVPASPRYAPQALTPSTPPLLLAAAAAAAATGSSSSAVAGLLSSPLNAGVSSNPLEHRIQFQLLPLPSAAGGHATHVDSSVRRLHFGADSGAAPDEHEDPEDSSFDSSSTNLLPALPSVTTGNMLVVPAGLTVRRLLAYVCQRLWKSPEHSWLLPPEMRAEIQAQKAASALAREQQSPVAAAGVPMDTRSKTPLVTPSKAAGVAGLGSPAAGLSATSLTPSAIHLGSVTAANGVHHDSPSKLRREVSLSMMSSVAHWERHTAVSPASPSPASPASPSPPVSALLKLPEHYLSMVLLNPVTGASQLLSADMEIGSVKDVMWSKMRRSTAQQGLLAVSSPPGGAAANPKRASNSTTNLCVVRGASGLLSSPSSPPSAESHSSSSSGVAGSRLMTLYYTRTPAGEEWAQSQMRTGGGGGVLNPASTSSSVHPGASSIRGVGSLDVGVSSLRGASPASNPIQHQSASRLALRASQARRDPVPAATPAAVTAASLSSGVHSAAPTNPVDAAVASTLASCVSVVLPAIPRIVPSVQTATNLPLAVPMQLTPAASPAHAHSHSASASASSSSSSVLPVSSPRRSNNHSHTPAAAAVSSSSSASAVGPLLSPSSRPASGVSRGSSVGSASRLPADPMSHTVSSGILSRHKTAGSAHSGNAASK